MAVMGVMAVTSRPRYAVVWLLLAAGLHAKKQPTVLEAGFKRRITAKLNGSAEVATQHLMSRLELAGSVFGGYELDVPGGEGGTGAPTWRHTCFDVEPMRDSVEHCGMRQMQALTTLCDVGQGENIQQGIRKHLRALSKDTVEPLGIKRMNLQGVVIWVLQTSPDSNEQDASPAFQASALMAVVRCADAVGERSYFQEAESWFQGLKTVYHVGNFKDSRLTFHKVAIIWESLAVVAAHLPRESSFYADVLEYIRQLEMHLRQEWEDTADTWSFASARALAVRWQSKTVTKKSQRVMMKAWAREHVDRFLGTGKKSADPQGETDISEGILARIGTGTYTCGPLQGLTSLAAILSNAQLVQVVLQLLEKDVDKYQISPKNQGLVGFGSFDGVQMLEGSFFRDDAQLKMEKRHSMRVDDVVQCVIALAQALKTLEGIVGVEIPVAGTGEGDHEPAGATAEQSAPSEEL